MSHSPSSPSRIRLQVNVDHVATVRQARGVAYPSPAEAAAVAEAAGADGITVHLRADRRHIQEHDVRAIAEAVRGRLNLEIATDEEMVAFAEEVKPDQVSLVPERPEEVTTEGGLDLLGRFDEVKAAAERLARAGVEVSLFLDPDPEQIRRAAELAPTVHGFEINTDAYTKAFGGPDEAAELEKARRAARLGGELGLHVYAGHGLTADNVGPIAALPEVEELNIGHFLIGRSIVLGLAGAVAEMLAAMGAAVRVGRRG